MEVSCGGGDGDCTSTVGDSTAYRCEMRGNVG